MCLSISRRKLLALAPWALAGQRSFAASADSMLWDYFMRELDAYDKLRRNKFAAIRTKAELSALQDKVQRVMRAGIGAFPERTSLNVQPVGELRKSDYVIEKIIFESRPEYYVTANVYRPLGTGARRPAVVQSCGHTTDGKADPDYQQACIGLAKKGFVALIFDPMGQGERYMFTKCGERRPGATSEHSLAGKPALLLGRTLANYRMWDVMRALDYLETRPDVEKTRMGMLGHSGGGMMTILTAPLEPRIRAAMSCCAVTSFYHKTKALLMADPEQIVPGIYPNGVDHPEMIATVAPRAFLIGAVLRDFVPLEGTRRTYQEVKHVYGELGVPGSFGKVESDNVHKLDQNLREACYGWMQKHLAGEAGNTREPEMRAESEENLRCTRSGCITDLSRARTVFDLNRTRTQELQKRRAATSIAPSAGMKALLGWGSAPRPTQKGDRIETEPGIEVVSTLVKATKHPDSLVVLAAEQGRNSIGAQDLSRALAGEGCSVLSVDLRGWGETTPHPPGLKAKFSWDEFLAWRSFEMGRPLLGMRVFDLVAVARQMNSTYRKVYVVGVEAAGLVALHAAAIEPAIAGVATWRTLGSFGDVMEHVTTAEPVSSIVPGVLLHYDIPELVRSLGARPAVAVDACDAERKVIGQPSAQPALDIVKGLGLA